MTQIDATEQWAHFYGDAKHGGKAMAWPSETIVRLFRGTYIPNLEKNYEGRSVIDIGHGSGNNLLFLGSLGLTLHGTEISESICKQTARSLEGAGYPSDLRVGSNRSIPFPDNTFDYLVSWNVLHYEENEHDLLLALKEYYRVLKPRGRLFISTTGPDDMILENASVLGSHRYQVTKADDFRTGTSYFYFDAPQYIHFYITPYFEELLVGRTHDALFTKTADSWIVTGIKRSQPTPHPVTFPALPLCR